MLRSSVMRSRCAALMRSAYDEQPGGHEWDFWDAQIKKIIDRLPLDEADHGFGSGAID